MYANRIPWLFREIYTQTNPNLTDVVAPVERRVFETRVKTLKTTVFRHNFVTVLMTCK